MFIEVQSEAEKLETFIRAGCEQHQKLLYHTLGWKHREVSQNTARPHIAPQDTLYQQASSRNEHGAQGFTEPVLLFSDAVCTVR